MRNRTKLSFIVIQAVVLLIMTLHSAFAEMMDSNEIAFIEAFEKSNLSAMERVLQNKDSKTDMSALLYSVLLGYCSVYSVREDFRPDYFTPLNNDKRTAYNVIELLIKYGANLNKVGIYRYCRDPDNKLILKVAEDFGPLATAIKQEFNLQVLQLMIDVGANPTLQLGRWQDTPLLMAVKMENIPAVRLLLENGAKVNAPGAFDCYYPLHEAVQISLDITKLLVGAGANVNQFDSFYGVPAEVAYESENFEIYLYLKDHGARWTAPNHATLVRQYGNSPTPAYTPTTPSYSEPSAPATAYSYAPSYNEPPAPSTPTQSSGERIAQALTQGLQQVQDTLRGSLDTGRYRMSGKSEEYSFTGMANNGNLYYKDASGKTSSGTYSISGNRLTINVLGRSFFYTITSRTSFSGNGDEWFYAGR
jgi:ankyrin repeat protein